MALDIEATGPAFGHDRIIEVGAARFRLGVDGHVVPGPTFEQLVHPGRRMPVLVSRLTGLTDADLADAPPLGDVWPRLAEFLGQGAVVLAHGARADVAWLAAESYRIGVSPLGASFHCTLDLTRRAAPKAPSHTLFELARHFGAADDASRHRALADALHTRNVFARCVALLDARTLGDVGLAKPLPWPPPAAFAVVVPDRLQVLTDAIADGQRCTIIYKGGSLGRLPRPITPLGYYAQAGIAYVRAWCHVEDVGKAFRLDRIGRVEVAELAPAGPT